MAQLPPHPSLDHLRRQARALQRAARTGDPAAVARVVTAFPGAEASKLPLSHAQTCIAREHGLASWPKLVAAVEARRAGPEPASDSAILAERWFALAELEDLRPLNRALAVGKARKEAARAVMQRDAARYAAFQRTLVRGLSSRRDRERFECAGALDVFGGAWTRAPLAPLMDDPVPRVRWMAMHALSCHGCGEKPGALEPRVRDRIVEATRSDPSLRVRHHAAAALALAGETSAIPVLRERLEAETDQKLLRGLAWALASLIRSSRPDKAAPASL